MIPYYKNLQVRSSAGRHSDVINMLSNVMRCNYNLLGKYRITLQQPLIELGYYLFNRIASYCEMRF